MVGGVYDFLLFAGSDGLNRQAKLTAFTGFDFHKYKRFAVFGDDVNLTQQRGDVIGGDDD